MRVLVVYGSERGGTAGLANMVGAAFTERGGEAQVRPASEVDSLAGVDAVVIGGALYFNHWHKDARAFVRRHHDALRRLPVWLFSSGPLDDSARAGDLAPVAQVMALAADLDVKEHMTFGGRLEERPSGFVARRMARTMAGDWRDREHVREWVHQICSHDLPALVEPAAPAAAIDLTGLVPAQRSRAAARRR